jgi:hypothetical protein
MGESDVSGWVSQNNSLEGVCQGIEQLIEILFGLECPTIVGDNSLCTVLSNTAWVVLSIIYFAVTTVSDYKAAVVMPVLLYGAC